VRVMTFQSSLIWIGSTGWTLRMFCVPLGHARTHTRITVFTVHALYYYIGVRTCFVLDMDAPPPAGPRKQSGALINIETLTL
jgi:hypothetical protein